MQITEDDVDTLADGCELLGSGGGGSTGAARWIVAHHLSGAAPVRVVSALDDDILVACVGAVGAASLMLEDLPTATPFVRAVSTMRRHVPEVGAVFPLEVGGVNGLLAVLAAAALDVPLLDADPNGRAYTRVDHSVLGDARPMTSAAFAGAAGQTAWFEAEDGAVLERMLRSILPAAGGWGALACHVGSAAAITTHGVPGTITRALELGKELRQAKDGRPEGLLGRPDVHELTSGTVVEIHRRPGVESGGVASIQRGRHEAAVRVDFANEFVALYLGGDLVASAPDLICVVDHASWRPIAVDRLAVMQRVRIISIDAPAELRAAEDRTGRFGLSSYGFADLGGR